jgi:hypothetical protein
LNTVYAVAADVLPGGAWSLIVWDGTELGAVGRAAALPFRVHRDGVGDGLHEVARTGGGVLMASVIPSLDKLIAHMPEVVAEVRAHADVVGARAEALFGPHDRPGGHYIEVTHDRTDSFVSLVGPAPLSVEYGRSPNENGKGGSTGLHILSRAAEL